MGRPSHAVRRRDTRWRATRRRSLPRRAAAAAMVALGLAVAGCSPVINAGGTGFPNRTIEIIVPFAAAGPTDTVARMIAMPLSEQLGVHVAALNVEGSGGTVATAEAAEAESDGYTLLLHHIGMSTAPSLYDDLPFDPVEDFAPIGLVTDVPMTIVSRAGLGPQTMAELADYAKENEGTLTLANAGKGSASQLCGVLLQRALGVQLEEIGYEGTGPAMNDLRGGNVDLLCDQTTNTTKPILSGEIDAYAVTTPERVGTLPEVPTTLEEGVDGVSVTVWHGLYAPAGTPDDVVARINDALVVALADESVIAQLAELGTRPVGEGEISPEALESKLTEQIGTWAGTLAEDPS